MIFSTKDLRKLLCSAMEDNSYEYNDFLDLETGELLFVSDYMDSEETEKLIVTCPPKTVPVIMLEKRNQ